MRNSCATIGLNGWVIIFPGELVIEMESLDLNNATIDTPY